MTDDARELIAHSMKVPVLYGISPTDPMSLLAVSVSLMLVAIAASYMPARWATRVDPIQALRSE